MTAQRIVVAIPSLLLLAGCATSGVTPRSQLVPQNGPRARIMASYNGDIATRRVRASFSVDKAAYVMVGHLAGDGRIRILYPEHLATSNRVDAKKTYAVNSASAQYDAVPQLYSFASRAYRSVSARADSYDGRGNGYLFVVASAYPLELSELATDGVFDEYAVEDYTTTSDPRYSINQLAQFVARGVPYTLDYADSFMTQSYSSYATAAVDCGMLSGILGGFMTSSAGMFGYGAFFLPPTRGMRTGYGAFDWYFYRPAMYYTGGYGQRGLFGLCHGASDFGPRYNMAMFTHPPEPSTWRLEPQYAPVDSPTTIVPVPVPLDPVFSRPRPAADASTSTSLPPASAIPRQRIGDRQGSPFAPRGARSSEIERHQAARPTFDPLPRNRVDKPSHNGTRSNGASSTSSPSPSVSRPSSGPASRAGMGSNSNPAPSSPPPTTTEIIRPPGF
jgi:hypothetical protein